MLSLASNVVKAKKGFFHIKDKPHHNHNEYLDEQTNNVKTFEKMAKDEKSNKDIPEEKYFFNKLNDLFQRYLGPTMRRQFNYFLVEEFVEESLLKSIDVIDEEELTDVIFLSDKKSNKLYIYLQSYQSKYAIKILRKDIDKRLFEEIIILQKVTENVEAFKHIKNIKGREVLFSCLKNLKYKYGKMGTFIQRQDEPVRSLYIIIKGLVQVKQVQKKDEKTPKRTSIIESFQDKSQRSQERKQSMIQVIKNQTKQRQMQMKQGKLEKKYSFQDCLDELNSNKTKCAYYNKGQSYGDQYILAQDDALADNQAYLFDNCHLAYLEIMQFKSILDEKVLQKLQKEIAEFSEMNIICSLEQKFIAALYIRTKQIMLKRNNVLTKEQEKAEFIYFIKEGEVKLTKKLVYENTHNQETTEKQKQAAQFTTPHQSVQNYDLAILGKGQFIGLEEFLKDTKYHSSSLIYSTEATLYQVSRYELSQLLSINKPIRDQILTYFEAEKEIDLRQERMTNFNQFIGKMDNKSKQIEEEKERFKPNQFNDEAIKKNLQQGQDLIIRSNINLSFKPQTSNQNLEFIMQSLKDIKFQTKKKKSQGYFMGCQFSEEDLENIKRGSKSQVRFSYQNLDSPTKMQTQYNKSMKQIGLKVNNNSPLKKSHQDLQVRSTVFDLQIRETRKYPSTLSNIGIDLDSANNNQITRNTSYGFPSSQLSERTTQLGYLSTSRLHINRNAKLKLDPININQSDYNDTKKSEKIEEMNNSIHQSEMKSPIGNQSIELHSDGIIQKGDIKQNGHKKLNLRLKYPEQRDRKENETIMQLDSSRYRSYYNDSSIQLSLLAGVDPIQIKSFSNLTTLHAAGNQPYNTDSTNIQQTINISKTQISRKNSKEDRDIQIQGHTSTKSSNSKSKLNLNRIHARFDPFNYSSHKIEREGSLTQRSQSQKNQFLPLKYRVSDIVESKDQFKATMYKDNQKRARLQQQTKLLNKLASNPYLEFHTIHH